MYVSSSRTTGPACLRSSLHPRPALRVHKSVALQAAADGSFFEKPDADARSEGTNSAPARPSEEASSDPGAGNSEPEKIPDSQWYPGILVYAITNVGFMKIFEFSIDVADVRVTVGVLVVFYAVAYALRFILHRVFKVDEKFPQFFWEGFPQRYKK